MGPQNGHIRPKGGLRTGRDRRGWRFSLYLLTGFAAQASDLPGGRTPLPRLYVPAVQTVVPYGRSVGSGSPHLYDRATRR